ncbi:uncharacterized protein LOC129315412 [Prosopis cineraria]|uniref:uncharacterized protein LOC129315412 n=1 Tax=Prosopis cineraria TaxID=364024 RepID=UPI00241027C1|nr:uncharacterized protein LOC129315412 [Prosopis cineraria]
MNFPPSKPSPTTKTLNAECTNCGFRNRSLLHRIQLRGIDRRLCTSCVLRLHPSSFCPSCFEFFDHPLSSTSSASAHRFLSCIKCSSLTHIQCLPSPPPSHSSFLCPPCSVPNFFFFEPDKPNSGSTGTRPVLNKKLVLVLLCAAKIASASMNKAVTVARAKADRTVREATLARKRAKEALQQFSVVLKVRHVEGSVHVAGSRNLGTRDTGNTLKVANPGPNFNDKK